MADEHEDRSRADEHADASQGRERDKDAWHTFTEEIEITGRHLVEEISRLIAEGNVRKVRIRSENDDVVLEVPLSAGAVMGGVVILGAPWLALLGALAGILAKVRLEVVRVEKPDDDDQPDAT